MGEFLSSNPGLESRFSKTINFEDYSQDELMEIFRSLAASYGYEIDPEANPLLLERFAHARLKENFGNGRFVRNLVEEITTRMARRLSASSNPRSRSELMTVTADDVREA
jgi:predicted AAA+ superfamily ATPase